MRYFAPLIVLFSLSTPQPAAAQQGDDWYVTLAPMYLSAARSSGHLSAGSKSVPVYMDFADAASNLAAAFAAHFEAGKGRWGIASDVNFMGLSSDTTYTILQQQVAGTLEYNQTIFELAGSYVVNPKANFALIGGLRTYTAAPTLSFTRTQTRDVIDTSQTSANFFAGFTYRPKLSDKWSLLTRADIGGGDARITWSATLGAEYRFTHWGGLVVAYRGLGIDAGQDATTETISTAFEMTHYGPTFGLNLHWGKQ
jgi:hypothetical protein